MAEERKLSVSEVRKTIAVSLAAAFGFVIALMWNEVVKSGLVLAGVDTTLEGYGIVDWLVYVVVAAIVTVAMIVLIILFGRWGSK